MLRGTGVVSRRATSCFARIGCRAPSNVSTVFTFDSQKEKEMPDKGPGSKSGGKKPKGGTKAGGGKKKK